MWQDVLTLTRREKSAILLFTLLFGLFQFILWTGDRWLKPFFLSKTQACLLADSLLAASSSSSQTGSGFGNEAFDKKSRASSAEESSTTQVSVTYYPFDPNTADSLTLSELGLSRQVVRNILKYRSKGGQFRRPEELAKIYGLDAGVYRKIAPWIRVEADRQSSTISSAGRRAPTDKRTGETGEKTTEYIPTRQAENSLDKEAADLTGQELSSRPVYESLSTGPSLVNRLELNTTDTAQLLGIKGVGAETALKIIRYGEWLGGYYDVSQLDEIKGIYPDVLARLKKTFRADPARIRKLNVNRLSLEKLKAHPYLTFYQAKAIIELRKARKGIRSLNELGEFNEFTPDDLNRLKWYLEF
jgi:DNA uptake protein ComE-like DNA-binding protein